MYIDTGEELDEWGAIIRQNDKEQIKQAEWEHKQELSKKYVWIKGSSS